MLERENCYEKDVGHNAYATNLLQLNLTLRNICYILSKTHITKK